MFIFLGNVSLGEFSERTGWEFTESEREWLESHRQDNATVRKDSGKFHIFDIPFCIQCSPLIKDELMAIAERRNYISNEWVKISVVGESEEEKREKQREAERLEREEQQNDPNLKWMWKWHMTVPIGEELSYEFFINTVCKGYHNHGEPMGSFWIKRDAHGLHGRFCLDNPEINMGEAEGYIVGIGMMKNGHLIDSDIPFDRIDGRIEEHLNGRKWAMKI